eukprot:13677499-Alexandrium_andersonii.AAC.1
MPSIIAAAAAPRAWPNAVVFSGAGGSGLAEPGTANATAKLTCAVEAAAQGTLPKVKAHVRKPNSPACVAH